MAASWPSAAIDPPRIQRKFDFKSPLSYSSDLGKTWTYEASEFPALSSVQRPVLHAPERRLPAAVQFHRSMARLENDKGMTFKSKTGEFTRRMACLPPCPMTTAKHGLCAASLRPEAKTTPLT